MKKLNNKGFTVVELILSFLFVFTLAMSMYQLLSNYREKQTIESIKSQMLDYKNDITLSIQNDITEKTLKNIDYCMNGGQVVDRCIVLNFNDGTIKQLAVEKGTKEYDGDIYDINYITYGGIIYEAPDAILLDFRSDYMLFKTYAVDDVGNNITIYHISIPIYHYDLDENYGISVVAVGYDYDFKGSSGSFVDGGIVQEPPEDFVTDEGRQHNGYVTTTNRIVSVGLKNVTMIARVKFDSSNIENYQQFFGNWQMGGSGLSLGKSDSRSSRKACFGAYVLSADSYSSKYTEVCSTTPLEANTFYTIVGTFDSANNIMAIYVNGAKTTLTLNKDSVIDKSNLAYAIGGNPGYASNYNLFYGTISNAVVYNRTISSDDVGTCLKSSVDYDCLKEKGYADSNKIVDEILTKKAPI